MGELRAEVRRLNGLLNQLGQAADGDGSALLHGGKPKDGGKGAGGGGEDGGEEEDDEGGEEGGGLGPTDIVDMRRKLITELKKKVGAQAGGGSE